MATTVGSVMANAGNRSTLACSPDSQSCHSNSRSLLPGVHSRQVVFVDSEIADLQGFVEGLPAYMECVLIAGQADGLAAMLAWLQGRERYDALHLVGHGRPGVQRLAATSLDLASVCSDLVEPLRQLGKHLSADADLLLYGCETAAGEEGAALLRQLARITSTNVAGSRTITGQGGDWELEVRSGNVQTSPLALENWQGALAALKITPTSAVFDEDSDYVTYKIEGMVTGGEYQLSFNNVSTQGMDGSKVIYTLDKGATWSTYFGSIKAAAPDMIVAVSTAPEQDLVLENNETFTLDIQPAVTNPIYTTKPNIIPFFKSVTAERQRIYSSLAQYTTEFTADALTPGVYTNVTWTGVGTFEKLKVADGDTTALYFPYTPYTLSAQGTNYMGAGGTFMEPWNSSSNRTPTIVLKLNNRTNYFGLFWAAADPSNVLDFYDANTLVARFTTAYLIGGAINPADPIIPLLQAADPSGSIGYWNGSKYDPKDNKLPAELLGGDNGWYKPGEAKNLIPDEHYAFLNFYLPDGVKFDRIEAYGKKFESDNWTVIDPALEGQVPPSQPLAQATATINDNGLGVIVPLDPFGRPLIVANGDVTLNNVTINEGSPFAVFTVTGKEGQYARLSLSPGTATAGVDYSNSLEFWNGSAWVAYTPGSFARIPSDGDTTPDESAALLVRVPIQADSPLDGGETFTLTATNTGGSSANGIATIVDDGSGTLFTTRADDPATPNVNEALAGVIPASPTSPAAPATTPTATTPIADPATQAIADDDRPLAVNNLTVNEGSPFAVFTVTGKEGQYARLSLSPGTATAGVDYSNSLEFWNGSAWVAYTPGSFARIPSDGDPSPDESAALLVRVRIKADTPLDGGETFTLTATNSGGSSAIGTATIVDDGSGTGTIFATRADDPTTPTNEAVPGVIPATATSGPALVTRPPATTPVADPATQAIADDDRPLSVNDVTVNERSPYLVWTVGGKQGQYVRLDLASTGSGPGHATLGTDTGTALEVFDGTSWVAYTPGTFVKVPGSTNTANGQLLVRAAVSNDSRFENRETLTLNASNTGGSTVGGRGTIVDDGTGNLFGAANTSGVPDPLGTNDPSLPTVLDDDRIISVNNLAINENSPYAVFTVTGTPSQPITLSMSSGTAIAGTDFSSNFETFDPITGIWSTYTSGSSLNLDSSGKLLVRTAIKDDGIFEDRETFFLTAKNTGDVSSTGTATIFDDGKGSLFNSNGSLNTTIRPDNDRPIPPSVPAPAMQQVLCIEDLFAANGLPDILSRLTGGDISRDRILNSLASNI